MFFFSLKAIRTNVFDLAILYDGSSFISQEQYRRTQVFAKSVLAFFNISQDQTHVAAGVYAREVVISFNFTTHYSFSAVSTAIDSISSLNQSSLNISAALKTVKTTLFASGRENVTRMLLILISEVLSGNLTAISQDLRDQGVIIIPIGVGNSFKFGQLQTIAYKLSLVLTTSFQHLDTMEGIIGGMIAEGKLVLFVFILFLVCFLCFLFLMHLRFTKRMSEKSGIILGQQNHIKTISV